MAGNKKTISYRYDSVRNRVGMTDSDGGRFTYAYDSVNRMTHMVNPQGERTTYAYDPAGRRTVKKLANGTRTSFSYDAAGNLTRLANLKSDGTTISSFDYDYDRVGNRKAVVEADGSRVTWSYDATYQLTGEHRTGSNAYRDTYTYDASGNRTLKNHDGARTTSAYDAANQLIYSEDASGRTTYTFDADGNQEVVEQPSGDRTTYAWDYENRMTSAQLPSGVRNTMAYEPDGLRVKLEESTGTKKFVWDEQNYLAETDENNDTQVVYTNEPRLYGNLVSQHRGSDTHCYHFDAIGSTRELTDASEVVTDTRLYDAWGMLLASSGSTEFPFTYAGQLGYCFDREAVSQYVRARFYKQHQGRWVSVDPLGNCASNRIAMGTSCYVHAVNNPLILTDPSGLDPFETFSTNEQCGDWYVACLERCRLRNFWIWSKFTCYQECGIQYADCLDWVKELESKLHKCPPAGKTIDKEGGSRTGTCSVPWNPKGVNWQYGCYCGAEPYPRRQSIPGPIDELDRCCCEHDNDYTKGQMSKDEADTRLCCCISQARKELKCNSTPCVQAANQVEAFFRCPVLKEGVDCDDCLKPGGNCGKTTLTIIDKGDIVPKALWC